MPGDAACSLVVFDSAFVITGGSGPCDAVRVITAPIAQTIIGAPRQPDVSFSISSRRIIIDSLNITVRLPIYLHTSMVMPALLMRMQPWLTSWPIADGSLVPWMPSTPSPPAKSVSTSEYPDSA